MTKLQRVQLSLVISGLTGAYVAIHAGMRVSENILAISTTSCGIGMLVGSVAALKQRTWGVGLVFAAAVAFGSAAALRMGPPIFYAFAVAGALPWALCEKPFQRFDRGAALLYGCIAVALGVGAAIAWGVAAPTIWAFANR
ncbi:MAG: hypothetical protein U0270_13190 [Labilithrix sp.]|jgi:hypothetical protein